MRTPTLALILLALPAFSETDWTVVKTFPIGGTGSWDYLTLDSRTHRLYVPRSTHTMVIDTESGKPIAGIPGQSNAHGVALAAGRGFISDGGGDGAVIIFDLKTNAVLGSIKTLPDTDGIIYDPHSNNILVVSGRGKALMWFKPDIDPLNGRIGEPVALHGEPEFLAADASGKVYINLMDTHDVAVVDLKSRMVVSNWPVAPGGLPVGMALDETLGRLYIGCRGPRKLIVMNTKDGKVLAGMPIGASVDAVKLYKGQAFASTAGSQLFVSNGERIVQTVTTGEGARTMAVDPATGHIYLPTADYETAANGKRTQKPGSFKILVVARQGTK